MDMCKDVCIINKYNLIEFNIIKFKAALFQHLEIS